MQNSFITIFIFLNLSSALAKVNSFYLDVFPSANKVIPIKVADPISDNPINTQVLKILNNDKLLGYVREITTTTGCNSACLPLIYTTFYSARGLFKKLKSRDGLTKINHAPFTSSDYSQLEFFMVTPNPDFLEIKNPKMMTDAISGATIKQYRGKVVPGAAYSTLRVYLYNQQTQKLLKNLTN